MQNLPTTGGGLIAIFFIIAVVALPLFVWGIHSDTHAARKGLDKLNRNFEALTAAVKSSLPGNDEPDKRREDPARWEV